MNGRLSAEALARRRLRERLRGMVRPSPSARGYGTGHRALRRLWAPQVAAGVVRCGRGADCLFAVDGVAGLIGPGEPWDLGHTPDRMGYTGPEHRRCNRATASRLRRRSREW
jgi:hypothetical protein